MMSVYIIQGRGELMQHVNLSLLGIIFFAMHNVVFYNYAKKFSANSQDQKYIGMVYLSVLTKLIIAVALPILYYYTNNKPAGSFVFPFIIIYVIFTVFETYVLNRMAVMRG
jgi:hypothetical protein